jgi:hypothetical protein
MTTKKKPPELDVFQLIANAQYERQTKRGSKLQRKLERMAKMQAIWKQTGIPEMWEQVKDIEVRNPAKNDVPGDRVKLADLVVKHNEANIYDYGLALFDSRDCCATWEVWIEPRDKSNAVQYIINVPGQGCHEGDGADKLRKSFVQWLAKLIEPSVIAGMGIEPKEIKKTERRILVETAE